MKKYDPLWSDINILLSLLRSVQIKDLITDHYAKYGNSAPATVMEDQMQRLQDRLDKAEQ